MSKNNSHTQPLSQDSSHAVIKIARLLNRFKTQKKGRVLYTKWQWALSCVTKNVTMYCYCKTMNDGTSLGISNIIPEKRLVIESELKSRNCKSETSAICKLISYCTELFSTKFLENSESTGTITVSPGDFLGPGIYRFWSSAKHAQ